MTTTDFAPAPVLRSTDEDGERYAHIVYTAGRNAEAVITEAIVMGTEVEALCGFRWVPSRDPESYPVCPKCKHIYNSPQAPV